MRCRIRCRRMCTLCTPLANRRSSIGVPKWLIVMVQSWDLALCSFWSPNVWQTGIMQAVWWSLYPRSAWIMAFRCDLCTSSNKWTHSLAIQLVIRIIDFQRFMINLIFQVTPKTQPYMLFKRAYLLRAVCNLRCRFWQTSLPWRRKFVFLGPNCFSR